MKIHSHQSKVSASNGWQAKEGPARGYVSLPSETPLEVARTLWACPVEMYPGIWPDFAANLSFTSLSLETQILLINTRLHFKPWEEFSGFLGRGKPLHLYGQLIIARSLDPLYIQWERAWLLELTQAILCKQPDFCDSANLFQYIIYVSFPK